MGPYLLNRGVLVLQRKTMADKRIPVVGHSSDICLTFVGHFNYCVCLCKTLRLPVQICLTGRVDGVGFPLSLWIVPQWKIGMAILESELLRGLTKPLNAVPNVPQGLKPGLISWTSARLKSRPFSSCSVFGTTEVSCEKKPRREEKAPLSG